MILYSVSFFTILVISQNVLPVCCQDSRAPPIHAEADVDTLEAHVETLENTETLNFTIPSTPSPDDVDCHVEIPTTMRIGGKCVRYGGQMPVWLCQAGVNAEVSSECTRMAYLQQMEDPALRRRLSRSWPYPRRSRLARRP